METGQRRAYAVAVLVVVTAVSPRIPLPVVIPGRNLELRIEDFLILGFLAKGFADSMLGRSIGPVPLARFLVAYSGVVTFTTVLGILLFRMDPLRASFYLGKELEYFVFFIVAARSIRREQDVRLVFRAFVVAIVINASWVLVQVLTGNSRNLLSVGVPAPAQSYGPHLIGEGSPLSTGGLFLLAFLVMLAAGLLGRRQGFRRYSLAAAGACGLVLSGSRSALVAGVVGLVVLFRPGLRPRRLVVLLLLAAMPLVFFAGIESSTRYGDRLTAAGIERATDERLHEIWLPLWERAVVNPLGYGKGSIGFLPGLGAGEAHNHYLRVYVEAGLLGLVAFLALFLALYRQLGEAATTSSTREGRALAAGLMAATVGLALAAVAQDVFVPVLLNELFWLLSGVALGAARLGRPAASGSLDPALDSRGLSVGSSG